MALKYKQGILTPFQKEVLINLFHSYKEIESFYLTGGTALAPFYLYHRYSDDLDLFTHGDFDSFKLEQVLKDMISKNNWQLQSSRKETLFYQAFIKENNNSIPLKIDFVKDISVHFGENESWNNIPIDSLRNIASNKIGAIFGRTEAKDFFDLYFLLQENLPLWDLFEEAKQKDVGLNEFYFAATLRNIEQINLLPRMIKKIELNDLKDFTLNLADKFLSKAKPSM